VLVRVGRRRRWKDTQGELLLDIEPFDWEDSSVVRMDHFDILLYIGHSIVAGGGAKRGVAAGLTW
jgi:hypothetical protein